MLLVRMWLGVLAEELSIRMLRDATENQRQPHSLQLYYRSGLPRQSGDHSKSCAMPHAVIQLLTSSCFRTSSAASSRQQGREATGVSMMCDKSFNDEGAAKFKEEAKCGGLDPMKGPQSTEAEPDREEQLFEEDPGFLETKENKFITGENGKNVKCSKVEDSTAKEVAKLLQQASLQLFQRIEDAFPCTRLAIAASSFHDAPAQGAQSIQHFFGSASQGYKAPSLKVSMLGPAGENTLPSKRKGLLRYMGNGTGPMKKNPYVSPSNEQRGQCGGTAETKEGLHDGNVRDTSPIERHSCRGAVVQANEVVSAAEPALDMLNSGGGCSEASRDPHNVMSIDNDVSAKEIQNVQYAHDVPGSVGDPFEDAKDEGGISCDVGCDIDFEDIDVDEQRRILEEIWKARSASQASNMSSRDKSRQQAQATQTVKRRKPTSSDAKSSQRSLSNYFHHSDT